jgi:hypothetical protein
MHDLVKDQNIGCVAAKPDVVTETLEVNVDDERMWRDPKSNPALTEPDPQERRKVPKAPTLSPVEAELIPPFLKRRAGADASHPEYLFFTA